jgi:hypothetical protein
MAGMGLPVQPATAIPLGAHLRVFRGPYWHHAIYIGGGWVAHDTGLTKDKATATVRLDRFQDFTRGDRWEIVQYARALPAARVVQLARSRLGERVYDLFGNNCEHFAMWCKTGRHESQQVSNATARTVGVGAGTALVAASASGVVATGEAAGLAGGASIMRGLATVGGAVGGGAAAGLAVLTSVPATVSVLAARAIYKDDDVLPADERRARQTARTVAAVAGVAVVVGSLAVVSAAGVPGLAAAGITSGLSRIGHVAGGRMLTGVVLAIGVPALIVALAAYVAYRVRKVEGGARQGARG